MTSPDQASVASRGAACGAAQERPLRKDAQRTRGQVMAAAKELFAERGLQVGFEEIARHAGVGVGTVYRRFPDREALVTALFVEKVEHFAEAVNAALQLPDPWEGVVAFCEHSIEEQQRDRGLMQVLSDGALGEERLVAVREQVGAAVRELLARAQRAGVVRADVEVVDLVLSTHLFSRVAVDDGAEVWRRYLQLFLDSIRARDGQQELSRPAPTVHMLEEIARRL